MRVFYYIFFKYLLINVLRYIYFDLLNSRLEYGILCWGETCNKNLKLIVIIKNPFIWCIMSQIFKIMFNSAIQILKVLSLQHLYVYNV